MPKLPAASTLQWKIEVHRPDATENVRLDNWSERSWEQAGLKLIAEATARALSQPIGEFFIPVEFILEKEGEVIACINGLGCYPDLLGQRDVIDPPQEYIDVIIPLMSSEFTRITGLSFSGKVTLDGMLYRMNYWRSHIWRSYI